MNHDAKWLVRKTGLEILGPFTTEDIRNWIIENKLSVDDEVCLTGGYWFPLSDRNESEKYFQVAYSEKRPSRSTRSIREDETSTTTQSKPEQKPKTSWFGFKK
jgi:hypothetical protein